MAAMVTERINDHVMHPHQAEFERGRRGSNRVKSPTSNRPVPPEERNHEELPRSASYTYLPEQRSEKPAVPELKSVPANADVVQLDEVGDISPSDGSPPESSGCTTPDGETQSLAMPQAREITAQLRKSLSNTSRNQPSESTRSSVESSIRKSGTSLESERTASTGATTPGSNQQHRPSLNQSLSKRLSGRSWIPSTTSTPSRSPSPQKQENATRSGSVGADMGGEGRRKSLISRKFTTKATKDSKAKNNSRQSSDEEKTDKPAARKGNFLRKKAGISGLSKVATNDSSAATGKAHAIPAVPALPKSFSTDRLPTLGSQSGVSDRAAPVPRLVSPDKAHHSSPLSVARKKDELWGVFRTLDADYVKFTSKSTALKTNVVRNSLIPFLRTYANHPSNTVVRLEDLDRRTNILNKWWTGLMEMLQGRNNQSISGTDRPAILDGVVGIMERPEWRLHPSPFCPLSERIKVTLANGNRSNTSLGSSSSDFLADSVHHNVRNIFIQNLTSQMAFVVDKMSLRNASASLVAFCGKACAYAFLFVPGMADVLVRLWDLSMDTIRRVLQENDIGKFDRMPESTSDIASNFPPALHQLEFTSLMKFMRKLRTPPPLPLGTTHIDWWGHWVERWSGRESDLFYVFVKQFHVLTTDFLPSDTSKAERLAAPGMLPVHAQILSNLDATIHRDTSQAQQDSSLTGISPTFDEMLGDPDAIASALPVPPINATRLMSENRLVMLIRDFLSERCSRHPMAREIFAHSFNDLLQAAARGTSMFDHSACYTLLDFLEEALVILVRYEHVKETEGALINSNFWQTVCRKMIDSENTMTEIRLYAFLYTVWNVIICDSGRKSDLCMDFLLDSEVFESRFNHWCPMVRAYYMRLLCWRLARLDEEEGKGDLRLLETIQERLLGTWSYYLYLRDKADAEEALRPATNPCHPAPGRRLLIVRTDNHSNAASSFLTFEGLLRDSSSLMSKPAWRRTSSSTSILDSPDSRPESSSSNMDSESDSREKGIGGFFRKIMGGSKDRSKSRGPSKKGSTTPTPPAPAPEVSKGIARAATDDGQATHVEPPKQPQQQYRSLSFKFSLEHHPANKQLPAMRIFPPRLPPPAQNYLQTHSKNSYSAESTMRPMQPQGESAGRARYSGRALAEWTIVVGECHSFFERRKTEGAPSNRHVETPMLGVEVFKRPS